jgi:CBS domain containing-hemolysin-like protein
MFKGETLDTVANIMAWVVLIIAPVIGISVFWLVHILPEKIAEQRQHPQAKAIQTLCLLSLAFGGLLWPLAWLWAYSKPVLYKMAYGTDRVAHGEDEAAQAQTGGAFDARPSGALYAQEFQQLRQRINELESRLTATSSAGEADRG